MNTYTNSEINPQRLRRRRTKIVTDVLQPEGEVLVCTDKDRDSERNTAVPSPVPRIRAGKSFGLTTA